MTASAPRAGLDVSTPPPPVEVPAAPVAPRPAPPRAPRHDLTALLVFAVVLGAGMLAITPHPLGVFSDDGMYAVLGKSLAEGRGYRFISLPGAPAGTHFPPVYPLLLAAFWKLVPAFPQNVLVFKAVNALLNAVAAVLALRVGERTLGLPRWLAVGTALLAGIGVPSLVLAGMVLSEPLFLVLLLASLPMAERVRAAPTVRGALLVGALGGVLMLTRSIGLAFIVGSVAALLLARRWRHAALVAVAAAAFVLPWQRWVASHDAELPPVLRGKYGSYTGWLSRGVAAHGPAFLANTAAGNVKSGARMTVEAMRVPRTPWSLPVALVAGAVVLALGAWRIARRAPVMFLTLGAYVGVVMLWPFEPTRFLWGIWPLVMLVLAAAIAEALPWLARAPRAHAGTGVPATGETGTGPIFAPRPRLRSPRFVVASLVVACAAFLVVGAVAHAAVGYQKGWHSSLAVRREATARPVLEWVLATTDSADVVASDEETMVYLYTGRLGTPATRFTPDEHLFPPSEAQRAADLAEVLGHYRPDWVVTTAPISRVGAHALAARTPPLLRIVDTLPRGGIVLRPVPSK